MNDEGSFTIVGTVKFPPRGIGLKVESVETNKGKTYKTTHEVLCFDKTLMNGLEAGDRIRVTGHLGSRKSEYTRQGSNGTEYPVYMTQLIARAILPAEEGQTQVTPTRAPARHRTQPAAAARQEELPPPDDSDIPF